MKIDCKALRAEIIEPLKGIKGIKLLTLMCVFEGAEASKTYVNNKVKLATEIGFKTRIEEFVDASELGLLLFKEKLRNEVENAKKSGLTGILVQLPLFPEWKEYEQEILDMIPPILDVDGFGKDALVTPCAPKGIMRIFDFIDYDLEGKNVVIIGRGKTVGKPLINLLMKKNATITIAHSRTKSEVLSPIMGDAHKVVIAAAGTLLADVIPMNPRDVIIDAGIFRIGGKIRGCFSESIKSLNIGGEDLNKFYTSSPGGVGILTVAMLMDNLAELKRFQNKEK